MTPIPCLLPHCRCTAIPAPGCTEVICAGHWRTVPRGLRRDFAEAERRCRPDGRADDNRERDRVWERCKAEAVEAVGGVR